jgi:hypothetical protein
MQVRVLFWAQSFGDDELMRDFNCGNSSVGRA